MSGLIVGVLNLSFLVILLVWKGREPFAAFMRARTEGLRSEILTAGESLRAAKTRNEEYGNKLKAIDAEVAALRVSAKTEAERARDKIVSMAKQVAELIRKDAHQAAEAAQQQLKTELRIELASAVVAAAEKELSQKLTGDDRVRLRKEFSKQVGAAQ